jgi:hypothetical protein
VLTTEPLAHEAWPLSLKPARVDWVVPFLVCAAVSAAGWSIFSRLRHWESEAPWIDVVWIFVALVVFVFQLWNVIRRAVGKRELVTINGELRIRNRVGRLTFDEHVVWLEAVRGLEFAPGPGPSGLLIHFAGPTGRIDSKLMTAIGGWDANNAIQLLRTELGQPILHNASVSRMPASQSGLAQACADVQVCDHRPFLDAAQ